MSMTVFEVLASLEVFGAEAEPGVPINRLPLIGVSADRVDRDGTIAISVARSGGEHFTHLIHQVRRLYIEVAVDGTTAGLLIESSGAVRTVIELRASVSPVMG